MRLVACGLFGSVILILVSNALAVEVGLHAALFGNSTGLPTELAPQILQGGALGVLAFTVWYMLTRTFPAHTAALKEQRESFLRALQDERREAQNERVQTFEVIERIVNAKPK